MVVGQPDNILRTLEETPTVAGARIAAVSRTKNASSYYEITLEQVPAAAIPAGFVTVQMSFNREIQNGDFSVMNINRNTSTTLDDINSFADVTKDRKSGSGLIMDGNAYKLTADERRAINDLSVLCGVTVKIVPSIQGGIANGIYKDGVIYIALDADNKPMSVFSHEITHYFQQAAPKAYEDYFEAVMEVLSSEKGMEVDELIKQPQIISEQYGISLTRKEAADELVADYTNRLLNNPEDTFELINNAQIDEGKKRNIIQNIIDAIKNVINSIKQRLTDKENKTINTEISQAEKVADYLQQMVNEAAQNKSNAAASDGAVKYSISEIKGKNGTYGTGVYLDTNIFDGVKPRNWNKVLSQYVYNNLAGTELVVYDDNGNSETISFAKNNERVTKDGTNNSHKVIDKLARTKGNINSLGIVHIDELLQTAADYGSADVNNHQWLDQNGWQYKKAYMQDRNGRIYETTLNIAKAADARNILYALSNTKQIDEGVVPSARNSERGSHTNRLSVNNSIYNSKENVKHSFKENADTVIENATEAENHFGLTDDFTEAGYITVNGKLLDFSGRHWGGDTRGRRDVDHSEIAEAENISYFSSGELDGWAAAQKFIDDGNIRLLDDTGGINLSSEPNAAQTSILRDYINRHGGEVTIDVTNENGTPVQTFEYNRGTSSQKVINDLKAYFNNGTVPQISDINKYRYSLKENAPFTKQEISDMQSIGRKSVNDFTAEDIDKTKRLAEKYYDELGAKSPFYRAEHGDWRAYDETPIHVVTERDSSRGVRANKDTGWNIQVSGKVFNETKGHKAPPNKQALPYLDSINSIAENAILLDSYTIPAGKKKSENSVMMHSFYALADSGNGIDLLKLYVEEMRNPNTNETDKRSYQLQKINKIPLESKRFSENRLASSDQRNNYIVADLFKFVKQNDKNFNPKSVNKNQYSLKLGGKNFVDLIGSYGAIPKGEKAVRDVEVPKQISETQYVSRFARTAMEAGVTPDDMVSEFEKAILDGTMTHEVITNKKAMKYATDVIQRKTFTGALNQWNALVDSGHNLNKKDIALGQQLYNQCVNNRDAKTAMKIASDLAVEATRAGQSLQAIRMLKMMSPDGKLYFMERSVDKINEEFRNKLGDKYKDIKLDEKLMQQYLEAMTDKKRNEIYDALCQNIADQIPSTAKDKWNAWRYLSMLGNARTHVRNIVGNAVFYPTVRIKGYMNAVLEKVSVPKEQRTSAFKKTAESKKYAEKDFKIMQKELQGVNAKYAITDDIESKRQIFKNKGLEFLRKKNSELLEAEDLLFLKAHYQDAFAKAMTARGIKAEFLDSNTKESMEVLQQIRVIAMREAQEATYRDANSVANLLNRLQRSADESSNKALKAFGLFGEAVMPFKKTPLNIAKRGVEYSPIGLLNGIWTAAKSVKNKEITAAEAVNKISKGIVGTGIAILGFWLASMGLISGEGDDDEKKREFDGMVGKQTYAFNAGGKSYTIDWMAPVSMPLFIGVELKKATEDTDWSFAKVVNAISKISEPILELSCLSGISDVLSAAQENKIDALIGVIESATTSYITQALPTLGGQIARIVDKSKRNSYYKYKDSQLPSIIQTLIGKAESKIPLASFLLEPKVDRWGREETYGSLPERIFENTISPGYYSEEKYTKVDKELERLNKAVGGNDMFPVTMGTKITIDKVEYNLDVHQYTEAARLRGQKSFELVQDLMNAEYYDRLSDEDKVKELQKCYGDALDYVKEEMGEELKKKK